MRGVFADVLDLVGEAKREHVDAYNCTGAHECSKALRLKRGVAAHEFSYLSSKSDPPAQLSAPPARGRSRTAPGADVGREAVRRSPSSRGSRIPSQECGTQEKGDKGLACDPSQGKHLPQGKHAGVGEHSALVTRITATDGLRIELEVRLGWMDKKVSHDAWMRSASAGVRSSDRFAVQMPSRLTRSNLLSTAKPGQTNAVSGLGRFTMRKSSRCG